MRELYGKFQQLCNMHFRSIYEVKTSVLTVMFIQNDVQCNILTLLNSGTRVCVFLKNDTNVKFLLSNARMVNRQKPDFARNYAIAFLPIYRIN